MGLKISQSMMKTYTDYLNKQECGLVFEAKYITNTYESMPSKAMAEGIYFEYLATGALPRTGVVPVPLRDAKGNLTADYQRITQAAEFFKEIIAYHGIIIKKVGLSVSTDDMTGITDILAIWNGREVVIDTKYSGLLDDKWNNLGWEIESLPMKDSLMIQGVHYKLLFREGKGIENIPFYYFVFNSKDPRDMKIIEQVVDEDSFEAHKKIVMKVKASIMHEIDKGFKAYPEYRRCVKCQLFKKCEKRQQYPEPIQVHYSLSAL